MDTFTTACFTVIFVGLFVFLLQEGAFGIFPQTKDIWGRIFGTHTPTPPPVQDKPTPILRPVKVQMQMKTPSVQKFELSYWESFNNPNGPVIAAYLPGGGVWEDIVVPEDGYVLLDSKTVIPGPIFRNVYQPSLVAQQINVAPLAPARIRTLIDPPSKAKTEEEKRAEELLQEFDMVPLDPRRLRKDI